MLQWRIRKSNTIYCTLMKINANRFFPEWSAHTQIVTFHTTSSILFSSAIRSIIIRSTTGENTHVIAAQFCLQTHKHKQTHILYTCVVWSSQLTLNHSQNAQGKYQMKSKNNRVYKSFCSTQLYRSLSFVNRNEWTRSVRLGEFDMRSLN